MTDFSIFHEKLAKSINGDFDKEIYDWDIIKRSITILIKDNIHGVGRNIVDFIDLGNWDYISNFSFDDSLRRLELEWHDNDKFHIYIDSIFLLEHNDSIYLFLKGFYHDEISLNKIYNTKCTSCILENTGSYMVDIYRVVKRVNEVIQTPNINCYTACILTRPPIGKFVTQSSFSQSLMDALNLSLAINKINSLYDEVQSIKENDRDSLQEKGNTARRYLEYILMLINIRIMHLENVQYQEQMLGSLVSVIKNLNYTALLKNDVDIAKDILNACSHHGGIRIEKKDVIFSLDVIKNIILAIENTDINKLQLNNIIKQMEE